MEKRKNNFEVGKTKMWLAVVFSYMFYALNIYYSIMKIEFDGFIYGLGIGISIAVIVLLINDMIKNKIFNRNFWILSMIIMPPIAMLTYMFQREKLMRLGNKSFTGNRLSTKNNN